MLPVYDYRCKVCKHHFTLTYKSVAAYTAATPQCPKCDSRDLERIISGVRVMRSEDSRVDALEDMATIDSLADADPRELGRMMRRMSEEVGEDLGAEMNEVVGRLEAGESPDSIEESMGDALDSLPGGEASFDDV